jgi:hypothetical protein
VNGGETVHGFQILKPLGRGREGEVFRARRDGHQYVLKVLHNPIPRLQMAASLQAYSERVTAKEAGFYPVKLIHGEETIVGLYYDYEPLFIVPGNWYYRSDRLTRALLSPDRLARALLSQYCLSQAYLLSRHSMAMQDGAQYMLGRDGRFRYIDYGSTIVTVDDEWCRARGYVVFSLLRALFEPSGIVLDRETRQPGFDYDRPCTMVSAAQQDELCHRSPWSAPIVARVRSEPASVFLDPAAYTWIADLCGCAVPHPRRLSGLVRIQAARRALAGVRAK